MVHLETGENEDSKMPGRIEPRQQSQKPKPFQQ